MNTHLNARGHAGLALLAATAATLLVGLKPLSEASALIVAAALASCMLPDVDVRLGLPHRRYTHSLVWAALLGLAAASLSPCCGRWLGIGVAAGYGSHVVGDLLTYMAFPPLWPLCGCRFSLGLFSSRSRLANGFFFLAGVGVYTYVVASWALGGVLQRNINIPMG